ncbi:MAG: response regulator transcription factor [Bacteroidota bacterium]
MNTTSAHLLYVEDDESLSFVTRDQLEHYGFTVTHCPDGHSAEDAISNQLARFDCCLLDIMLPGVDGFELAQQIRAKDEHIPILFLTAKSMKEDRLKGLRTGGDDYITKPFSVEELILRIEVFLKRNRIRPATPAFDPQLLGQYQLKLEEQMLHHLPSEEGRRLTQREAELLHLLSQNRNQILERGIILERLWGKNDYFLGRSLDVFISRLRKYLQKDERLNIENIHGVGFSFQVPEG